MLLHERTFAWKRKARQQGIALLLGLIFLMMLSLLALTAIKVSIQQERTSGNSRDYSVAFEAAEASLRDCESVLQAASLPVFDGSNGLYDKQTYPADAPPLLNTINWDSPGTTRINPNPNVNWIGEIPRCFIERHPPESSPGSSLRAGVALEESALFTVTARALGQFPGTTVLLQTTYAR